MSITGTCFSLRHTLRLRVGAEFVVFGRMKEGRCREQRDQRGDNTHRRWLPAAALQGKRQGDEPLRTRATTGSELAPEDRGIPRQQICLPFALPSILGAVMTLQCIRVSCGIWVSLIAGMEDVQAAELPAIPLPAPNQTGGKPLMAALKERQSIREFSPQPLPPQALSDLLWAGFGINRPENDHRTAPSTMNMQEVDLYVALADGLYLYEAKSHQLRPVLTGDLHSKTGGKVELQQAPAILILVADFSRMTKAKPQDRDFYAAIDTGFISQNAYLYCASAGLATVVHELDRPPLAEAMKLRPEQKIIIAQSVGYPK